MIDLNKYRKNIYQNFGARECPHYSEDGIIVKIFEKIGVDDYKLAIEFGETRVLGTTTRAYRIKYKSKAIYFTQKIDFYSKLLNTLDVLKTIAITKDIRYLNFFTNMPFEFFATSENIAALFKEKLVKKTEIDILTIDIDSYDYYVAENILKNGYKPKLLILEYNPSLPLTESLTYPNELEPIEKPQNGRVYGASYLAMYNLAKKYGYKLVYVTGICNLFFVREEFSNYFLEPDINIEATITDKEVMDFCNQYCQDNFVPSWLEYKGLSNEDINFFIRV